MANFVDTVSNMQKFLSVLTWKKLVQLLAFIFVIGLTWTTYENREIIYGYASQKRIDPSTPHIRELSKKTVDEIKDVVERSELIVGIQVIMADFQKNQRVVVYTYIDSSEDELRKILSRVSSTSISNVPLFSEAEADNKYLVALINGEFLCRPFDDTLLQHRAQDASRYVKSACSNGIPASYGRFTGLIVVYLKHLPKPDDYDQIRSVARSLSTTIFERDLNK